MVLGLRVRCRISLGNSGGLGPRGKMASTAVVCAVLGHSRADTVGRDRLQAGAMPDIWGGHVLSTHLHPKPQNSIQDLHIWSKSGIERSLIETEVYQ